MGVPFGDMNNRQRAAAMVGVVLVLFAVGRMLTPFSTRVILNPTALRAVTRVEPCGMALSEAVKAPSLRSDDIRLTAAGEQQKQLDIQQRTALASVSHRGAVDPFGPPDATFDHFTVTTFTLSPCESAARRRVTSAAVLVGLAVVGAIAALVLLRDPRHSDAGLPVP